MKNEKKSKNRIIWLIVLILLLCVVVSTLTFTDILDVFLPDDSGAIPLVPAETVDKDKNKDDGDKSKDPAGNNTTSTPTTTTRAPIPGFEVYDDKGVWKNKTDIELFKISYENGEKLVTVASEDGAKVIAPGTENSYVFKLKNTGEVAMKYTMEIEASCEPKGITIPITARLCRYDGKWVSGSKDSYSDVATFDKAVDHATLGVGKFTYYTLDWCWPYEGETDELDTLLGNMALEEDVTFTIRIRTYATEHEDPNADGGITSPQTGDAANPVMWTIFAVLSFAMILFILFAGNRDKKSSDKSQGGNLE